MANESLALLDALLSAAAGTCVALGYRAIRRRDVATHRRCMLTAFALASVFLISFVTRVALFGIGHFHGRALAGRIAFWSLFVSHDALAVLNVPLAVVTLVFGLSRRLDEHREVARITVPIWLYVSASGVVLYFVLYVIS